MMYIKYMGYTVLIYDAIPVCNSGCSEFGESVLGVQYNVWPYIQVVYSLLNTHKFIYIERK